MAEREVVTLLSRVRFSPVTPNRRASCGSPGRCREVAQLAEQWILVPPVPGSIPGLPANSAVASFRPVVQWQNASLWRKMSRVRVLPGLPSFQGCVAHRTRAERYERSGREFNSPRALHFYRLVGQRIGRLPPKEQLPVRVRTSRPFRGRPES